MPCLDRTFSPQVPSRIKPRASSWAGTNPGLCPSEKWPPARHHSSPVPPTAGAVGPDPKTQRGLRTQPRSAIVAIRKDRAPPLISRPKFHSPSAAPNSRRTAPRTRTKPICSAAASKHSGTMPNLCLADGPRPLPAIFALSTIRERIGLTHALTARVKGPLRHPPSTINYLSPTCRHSASNMTKSRRNAPLGCMRCTR